MHSVSMYVIYGRIYFYLQFLLYFRNGKPDDYDIDYLRNLPIANKIVTHF